MAYIQKRQRADGQHVYRVRIRVSGSPDISETFLKLAQAKAWARKKEVEIRDIRYFPKDFGKDLTFANLVERYIEKELPKKPKSFAKQSKQLQWWKKHLGKYFLSHITAPMVAEIRDEHLLNEETNPRSKRSPSTANRYLAVLSHAFSVAVKEWAWIKENPVSKVTRPKEGKARERFLEKDEIIRLLTECRVSQSPHLYPIVLFALTTGARKGEILALKWPDIDFMRATATFHDTKNGDTRTVSLGNALIDCLKEERKKRAVFSLFVFPSADGKKAADIRTAWDKVIEKTGLKNVSLHTLRHTAASHLAMSGASTLEIAAILGHKTLAMVKRYSHLSVSATSRALQRMNQEILGDLAYG